jgi:hypothetical protein
MGVEERKRAGLRGRRKRDKGQEEIFFLSDERRF